jgi:glutathione S-transferase
VLALYDHPVSSNALKVRFLLAELELPYERRTVPIERPRPQWYVDINPLGGIPALDDDGFVLTESNSILRYLANREGRDDLYPAEPRERGRVDAFLDRFSLSLRPALFRVEADAMGFTPLGGLRTREPDPDAARATEREIAPTLRTFDAIVGNSGYVLGGFTIADCAAAPALFRTTVTGLDLAPYPNLLKWRDTLVSRPGFAAAEPVE